MSSVVVALGSADLLCVVATLLSAGLCLGLVAESESIILVCSMSILSCGMVSLYLRLLLGLANL